VGLPRGRPVRPGRPVSPVPWLPALAAGAPGLAAPGQPQRLGSGLLPSRLRQADRAGRRRRRARRGTVRPGPAGCTG
jgi:hypothetical protein